MKKITRQAKREYEKDMARNIKHNDKALFMPAVGLMVRVVGFRKFRKDIDAIERDQRGLLD